MCIGEQFGTCSMAVGLLREAQKSLQGRQYQKALDGLEQAEKEIQKQKADLRKYLEKRLKRGEDAFQGNEEDMARLKKLNSFLEVIEHEANAEAERIKHDVQARLGDEKEFLTDYEIEIEVVFVLREDDPDYEEDEDNILVTLDCGNGFENGDERYDYNTVSDMLPFRHCALFHALYDHVAPSLHWNDLLRIGSVWVSIGVEYQKCYDFAEGRLQRDNWMDSGETLHHNHPEGGDTSQNRS